MEKPDDRNSTLNGSLAALQSLAERRRFGMKPGLDTIKALLAALGNPHQQLAAIHIAGTNGKGATAAICESVLRHAGYRVARYTSPHLLKINERFMVNGSAVDDAALERSAAEVLPVVRDYETATGDPVTYFESLTALAFHLFSQLGIKLAVLETGLGGRMDATNVVTPLVSVITRIGLDHCDWLGDTVAKIAAEKAGIIKAGRPVVCGLMPDEARAVVAATANRLGSRLILAEEAASISSSARSLEGQTLKIATANRSLPPVKFPLAGAFQAENALTAAAALECAADAGLEISDAAFANGFANVVWPGRFQLAQKQPPVVIDGAHNPEGARALLEALKSCRIKKTVALVAGFCGDKDAVSHLRTLAPHVGAAWAVEIPNPRSLTAGQTAGLMHIAGIENAESCESLKAAVAAAAEWAENHHSVAVVCGSLFLAGAALELFGAASGRRDPNELLAASAKTNS